MRGMGFIHSVGGEGGRGRILAFISIGDRTLLLMIHRLTTLGENA